MLQARARSFALRDVFPDVLLGLSMSAEELGDIPAEEPAARRPALADRERSAAAQGDVARPVEPPKVVEPPAEAKNMTETITAAPRPDAHPLYVNLPGGGREEFPRTKAGLRQALDFMEREVAPLVMNNLPLLDMAAEKFPDLADRIAELRAAAAEALTPPAEDGPMWPEGGEQRIEDAWGAKADHLTAYDTETGEVVDDDRIAQQVAERRGAAPRDTADPELGLSVPS
jgi:hypothetical protein